MEQYTLNRFYFEAKALLEKYQLQGKQGYEFHVDFKLEESEDFKSPSLHCSIWYCPANYNSTDSSYHGFGVTPYICLGVFEETLKNKTGKPLIENLAVEL